jgi:hypothetical protein
MSHDDHTLLLGEPSSHTVETVVEARCAKISNIAMSNVQWQQRTKRRQYQY